MKRAGFTLIEMLVVTTILILLGSLTLPAIGRAMDRSQAVRCMSNLRTMGQAVSIYLNEHDGQFPPALVSEDGVQKGWDFFIDGDGEVSPGWIWESYGVDSLLQCPSYEGSENWLGEAYTGYNYNSSYLGGMRISRRGREISDIPSARMTHIAHPERTAMFGDGAYAGGANKFMRSPMPGPLDGSFQGREGGTQGYRHQGYTHVVFVDGRVMRFRPVGVPSGFSGRVAEGTGFLSMDNMRYGGE